MELWAGFECTLNRVGSNYSDQLDPLWRHAREQCLESLGDLGVSKFRYRVAWDDNQLAATWLDADMAQLEQQGVEPIMGLLHHGSGPAHTNLLCSEFASGLADHARCIAERFPHVEFWTPVNEPLTTARFSALYGHWYPHARSERKFWLALLNQIDATRFAMTEIRQINPAAQLIQTEDLGISFATAAMADQAAFDNQRRWMTWDLLCGRLVPGHPLYKRLAHFGFEDRLEAIADDPCPPDIVGVDHYLTSDRFLDHRSGRYPKTARGTNGRQHYADVEAVRVLGNMRNSIEVVLAEAWQRYGIPVALTECHNGCTREEQIRWLRDGWRAGEKLNMKGVQVEAVTSWALLGARNWSSLAIEECDDFESGAFDPRGNFARPTAVAASMRALTQSLPLHPASAGQGWWQRNSRHHYPSISYAAHVSIRDEDTTLAPPLLIAGATGTLGQALLMAARARGIRAITTSRQTMPLDQPHEMGSVLDRHKPWAVINATGWVRVDDAEQEASDCRTINVEGALALAQACETRGIAHVHFSSDLVFDGANPSAYDEQAASSPLNIYGKSKADADKMLLTLERALVIRTAAFFSPYDRYNFAAALVATLRDKKPFAASAKHHVTPTYVPHLVDFVLDLLIDEATGLWHASNGEELSWQAFGIRIAEACKLDTGLVGDATELQLKWTAQRPLRCGLVTNRGQVIASLDTAIQHFASVTIA